MAALSDDTDTLKFVHTYGAGLHSGDTSLTCATRAGSSARWRTS
jgi:hypothetical protein